MGEQFKELISFNNLHKSYRLARNNKRYRVSILKFSSRLEENLISLQQELMSKTYIHGEYKEFVVTDSKPRIIHAPNFKDRVVHHAFCEIVESGFDRSFIYDSYACRFDKGTHTAFRRVEHFLRSIRSEFAGCIPYCLKCDISKYFKNVNQDILLDILSKKIGDEEVFDLARKIVRSFRDGIPIGNLTSQLFANIYLNELDHFVKRELKERYYIRYMDDFLILGTDKRHLAVQKERIREFLRERLKLELHPRKCEIFPIDKGLDFLGYVLINAKRRLRKSTVKRFIKREKRCTKILKMGKMTEEQIEASRKSWLGYAKFADSWGLRRKLGI